jgi:hypothetical protein
MWVTGRLSILAWSTPMSLGGDANLVFANAKVYLDGDSHLIFQKYVQHLNAPFQANWNDWPITEDLIFASIGYLGRLVGLFTAGNIFLYSCHLLAGLSFWFCCKEMRSKNEYIFLGSICFAFSHFIFARGLPHLVLSFYWYLPWLCLISWWAAGNRPIIFNSRKGYIAIIFTAIAGSFNPYFAWMYLMFLGFAVLKRLFSNIKLAYEPVILIFITVSFFLLFNFDTLSYKAQNGENIEAVSRSLAGLELYGLKIPELFLPPAHRLQSLGDFAQSHYYQPSLIKGEMGSPYLGFLGILGLLMLTGIGLVRLFRGNANQIHPAWWQVVWIALYSLIGGINLMLGSFGLVLFRGTNRFSIYILTLSLMFLVWFLSKKLPNKIPRLISLLFIPIILWDQLPPKISKLDILNIAEYIKKDKGFSIGLESKLPKGAMIFQLPIMAYPESPPIVNMGDYEHFRPYFYSTNLRYSYGGTKGRGDEGWQKEIESAPPLEIVRQLERYGFSGILVNRSGYLDGGESLIAAIIKSGGQIIEESNNLIAFKIQPSNSPTFPPILKFSYGWSGPESGHRWSEANQVSIQLKPSLDSKTSREVAFYLQGLKSQKIAIYVDGVLQKEVILKAPNFIEQVKFPYSFGKDQFLTIKFISDVVPEAPGNGDPRKLAFSLVDLKY